MSLLSASLRVTVSRLIFCFVALSTGKPLARLQNSASATCRFKNIFIFDVGRCARSTVRGREHSLTCRPLWYGSRGDNQCDAAKIPHLTHKGWFPFFGWGITRNGFSMACRASATCSSSGHVASAAVGERLTPTVILPMSMSIRVSLSSWVPAAAASFSAARVVLLVLPVPQPQLMVVRCVWCGRMWSEEGGVAAYVSTPKKEDHRNRWSRFYTMCNKSP
jgi:hypothetical protein